MKLGHQKQMAGNLLGSPKTWVLGTKKKEETFWALQKHEFWAPKTNVRKPSGLCKIMTCQGTFWALQNHEFWAPTTNVSKPSALSKNMSFGHQKRMAGNLLDSPKTCVLETKNKMSGNLLGSPKTWVLGNQKQNIRKPSGLSKKHEFWAPKTNVRKPSGLCKIMNCQGTFWALQNHEFWAPKTNVRKPSGLSKNMSVGHQKQISGHLLGSPKTRNLGTKNKCQETFWVLQKHEFWAPITNVSKPSGLSKNMSSGQQKQMSGNLWALQKHEFRVPKINVRKPSGLSKNMSFGHQKQMSGNLVGSPKTWDLGTNNKCQEAFWALQKNDYWAPKTNVSKPSGLSKNMNFGYQKQKSGNLLDSSKIRNLSTKNKCQETFWALPKHEFWAPKTNVRQPSGFSKNMSFEQQKQMSGNLLGSPRTWVLGTKSKCQETFWALQKYEFWAPKTNVRKPSGFSKTWVLGTKNKWQEIFWALQKHEFWAPKTNVRKPSGLSKNMTIGHQKQMPGNLLGSPKTWVLGTNNKYQETFWTIQKYEFWAPKTNVRKPSGLSKKNEFWAPKSNVRKPSGLSKNMKFGHHKQMAGNLLGSPKTWVLGANNKCQESFCMGSPKTWVLGTKKKENLLGAPKTWVLGTKNKCQEIFWAFQKHEFWAPKTNVRKPSGLSKNMSFGHQKQMSGNLLDSPKIWVLGTKNKRQETFWARQKYEFWAPKTYVSKPSGLSKTRSCGYQKNARKPSGLSKNRSFGHQKQMSANRLGSPKTSVLGIKNKCQETFWALQKHEFWTAKTNVRKPSGLSKKHEFWAPKKGNLLDYPKTWVLGTENECQEILWALQKHEFWEPRTNVRKPSGLSKNMSSGHQKQMSGSFLGSPKTWVLDTKNKCQETFWALQEHEIWAPKTNGRKSSGLSKNMNFGYQKQMSGNRLGSPKTWVLGTKNKCQEILWALQKHEIWAPKTDVRKPSGLSKTWILGTKNKWQEIFWALQNHGFWAPKTNVRKPSGLSKNMTIGHQKQMSGNLLGSPKKWVLGTKNKCQEAFWALRNMSFGHQKQMSGNLLGSPKIWVLGTKNKCQETFWAIQKHEFWKMSKNMSFGHQKQMSGNLLGSPKTWVLGANNKCQETFWTLQKHELWAPKTNVRKPSGLSKNKKFGHQKQMSGNLLGSPKKWVLGTKNKCQETVWSLQKSEFWAPTTNVRKPSVLFKNKKVGHQKQMSANLLGSPQTWVLGTKKKSGIFLGSPKTWVSGSTNKCQETFWALQKHELWAPKGNVRKPFGL